jgi:hypothetical protein
MKLTERSRKIFVEALTDSPKPNDAAIAAAKRFSKRLNRHRPFFQSSVILGIKSARRICYCLTALFSGY